jgi:hypothetical protein
MAFIFTIKCSHWANMRLVHPFLSSKSLLLHCTSHSGQEAVCHIPIWLVLILRLFILSACHFPLLTKPNASTLLKVPCSWQPCQSLSAASHLCHVIIFQCHLLFSKHQISEWGKETVVFHQYVSLHLTYSFPQVYVGVTTLWLLSV